jgi:hypothetical protein
MMQFLFGSRSCLVKRHAYSPNFGCVFVACRSLADIIFSASSASNRNWFVNITSTQVLLPADCAESSIVEQILKNATEIGRIGMAFLRDRNDNPIKIASCF